MDPAVYENMSGVRSTYLALPNSQALLDQLEAPLALQYTPKKDIEELQCLDYNPVKCSCGAIVNPYCTINYNSKSWFCCVCQKNNKFPGFYAQNLDSNALFPELLKENFVVEYEMNSESVEKSRFVFLVDMAMSESNFAALKENLLWVIENTDFDRNEIALMTFSRSMFLYKNTPSNSIAHSIMIPPSANLEQIKKVLYVKTEKGKVLNSAYLKNKYYCSNAETLRKMVDSLEHDFWVTPDSERAQRATGKALDIALDLVYYTGTEGARLMLFTSGPPTIHTGGIAELKIAQFIRKPPDLEDNKDKRAMVDQARKFYNEMATKAVNMRVCVDIFAFSLDEFGLFEMRDLINKTGGLIILNEEFKQNHFKEALAKLFTRNEGGSLNLNGDANLELHCSKELKIRGCIGNCASLKQKNPYGAGTSIGESNTNKWFLGGLDNFSTYTFFFDVNQTVKGKAYSTGHQGFFQFITTYKHNNGKIRMRVATLEKPFLNVGKANEFLNYLDQFCIVSVFAKIAAFRSLEQDSSLVIRYLDKKLIGLMKLFKFGDIIPEQLNIIPQYFYYLRKSNFVKKYASSLDEMVYYRNSIIRQNIDNTLVMIQPQIIEYSLENEEPVPVLPNLSCLKSDVVLLCDTYFNIIIWYGQNVKGWIDEEYHLQEGYEHIKELIDMPEEDMRLILEDRLVVPNKVKAHMGSPSERLIKSKLNPETQDKENSEALETGNFVSDDASLSTFMNRLFQVLNQTNK